MGKASAFIKSIGSATRFERAFQGNKIIYRAYLRLDNGNQMDTGTIAVSHADMDTILPEWRTERNDAVIRAIGSWLVTGTSPGNDESGDPLPPVYPIPRFYTELLAKAAQKDDSHKNPMPGTDWD